jgi:penicillin-binding protein 2
MAKHKRMVYEPPGSRKRRRRGENWNGGENFLTRRMFIAKAGVVTVFAGLTARLGFLQLVQGEEYKTLAADNVIRTELLPAPRGIIYDRQGRPLAENRRTWEVRVTKAQLPEDAVEQRRVLDMLISALQMEDVVVIRPSAVPDGSEDEIFQRIAIMFDYDQEVQQREFAEWRSYWSDRLIKVASVSLDDAARFRSASAELPGVQVMNEVDYLVGNIWAPNLPVTIKANVPREVALKLEANAMYMPGVTVDDAGLSRHYPGGEVMSHALGYVRTIDGVSLDDLRNRDESNQRIYDQNDTIGKEGLEQALEARLRGQKGRRSVEVDAAGVVMRTIPGSEIEPVEGDSVYLTIDLEFQRAVGEALRKGRIPVRRSSPIPAPARCWPWSVTPTSTTSSSSPASPPASGTNTPRPTRATPFSTAPLPSSTRQGPPSKSSWPPRPSIRAPSHPTSATAVPVPSTCRTRRTLPRA